ncbi:MAG TPA: DUF454 domain-containing protein [Candidatus Bathyarchaeota archaeon]|nr:DUF454 domain-containing protein [Candidatus Bathyarchaeota archaeon]
MEIMLEKKDTGTVKKYIYLIVGSLALVAGIIGVFLPILPTTPFVLLSAWCFFRSSDKLYKWVINNETFGPTIMNYQQGKGITQKTRIRAIVMMWATISFSAYFFVSNLYVIGIMYLVAISVSVYLYRLPTATE